MLTQAQWRAKLESAVRNGGARAVDELRALATTPAPNAIEWVARPEFLGSESIYEFFGSYQAVRDYFELLCPICARPGDQTVWYTDANGDRKAKPRSVLESQTLLVWDAREEDDRCPKCRVTRHELHARKLVRGYNQFHGIIGQRSGKSYMGGSYFMTYFEHRLICAGYSHPGRLQGWFRAPANDNYEITLLASSEDQSKDTIWARFFNQRRHSPWHRRVIPWISALEKTQHTPDGMLPWAYTENLTSIVHGYLQLEINSLNSNSQTARGRTRLASALDELCYMKAGDGPFSAREIYAVQEASLVTVRKYAKKNYLPSWLGTVMSISSPNFFDDYGMELLRSAPETPGMYYMHAPTWHFNPELPESEFEGIRRKDPFKWAKNFAANPPAGETPLVHDWHRWRRTVEHTSKEPSAVIRTVKRKVGDVWMLGMELVSAKLQLPRWDGAPAAPRVITLDAGATWDAFAIYCAHADTNDQGEVCSVQDFAYRIVPEPGVEPWYESVVSLIVKLSERMPISHIRADRWNSKMVIQALRKALPGISVSDETPCTDEDVANFMRDGYGRRVVLLAGEEYRPGRPDVLGGDQTSVGIGAEDGGLGAAAPLVLQDAATKVTILQASNKAAASKVDTSTPEDNVARMHPHSVLYHEFHKLQRDPKGRVYNPAKGKERGVNSDDLARCAAHAHKLIVERDYVRRENDNSRDARAKRARTAHEVLTAGANTRVSIHDPRQGASLPMERSDIYQPAVGTPGVQRPSLGNAALPGSDPYNPRARGPVRPRGPVGPQGPNRPGRGW